MVTTFQTLSDGDLLNGLKTAVDASHETLAQILSYLVEVDERRLHVRAAIPSLVDYCVKKLRMSEDQASRRVVAASVVRQFPGILAFVERGDIHLTNLLLLRDYLTEENHDELLKAASGLSKMGVKDMLAARFPVRDTASRIEPLDSLLLEQAIATTSAAAAMESIETKPKTDPVEPLSPNRYQVTFTADEALRDQITRALELMAHRNPTNDLNAVMRYMFSVGLKALEKERFAKRDRPTRSVRPRPETANTKPPIPRPTRRAVFERDGEQCAFVSADGTRCGQRSLLEIDHIIPRARGGTNDLTNLRVRCKWHNQFEAEEVFGKNHMATWRSKPRQRGAMTSDDVFSFETVTSALTKMGFAAKDARRAIANVQSRMELQTVHPLNQTSLANVIREALAILT